MPLLVLALVAVVAVASSGGGPWSGDAAQREPSAEFFDYAFTFALAATVVLLAIVLYLARPSARFRRERTDRHGFGASLFALAIAVVVALLILLVGRGAFGDGSDESPATSGTPAPQQPVGATTQEREPQPYRPDFKWLPLLLIGGAAVATAVGLAARSRLQRRLGERTGDAELVLELASLVDDAVDDLRAEPDPRRAVIAAYARMERALAAYGLPRRPFEAPLEFLDRVASTLGTAIPAARNLVFELTHLFERAKFSAHEVDSEMKNDAIAALLSLRDELRTKAEAA